MNNNLYFDYVFLLPGNTFSREFLSSWSHTLEYLNKNNISYAYQTGFLSVVQEIRNLLIHHCVINGEQSFTPKDGHPLQLFDGKMKCKKVIFIDSDIVWSIQDLEKLLFTDKDVMCANYVFANGSTCVKKDNAFLTQEKFNTYTDIIEVEGFGLGFVSVSFEALNKMSRPLFNTLYYLNENNEMHLVGEDFFFCNNLQQAGYTLYCDPSIRVGHQKSQVLRIQ